LSVTIENVSPASGLTGLSSLLVHEAAAKLMPQTVAAVRR
jgi:hypothetical protein